MPIVNNGTAGCATGGCSINTKSTCASGPKLAQDSAVASYKVGDLVNKLCQTPLNVWKWSCGVAKYASLPYLTLNMADYNKPSGGIGKVLQFKNIPQYHTLSEDGESVKWGEMVEAFPEAFADGEQNSSTIKVKTLESLRRFYVDDYVIVYSNTSDEGVCCGTEVGANIVSIDRTNLTITFDRQIKLLDGDRILRQYNLIHQCGEFENGVSLQPTDYFESYYQYFGGKLSFTVKELNICYSTPRGVNDFLDAKFMAMYQDLFLQVGNSYWNGRNVKEIAGTQKAQSMGVLPAIYSAFASGMDIVHDLSKITVDIVKVRALLSIFEQAQHCQIEGIDNTLVVACNYKFYQALSKLGPAWNQLVGCMPMCDGSNEVKFEIKTVKTIYGKVEFYADWFLQYYYPKKSFAVLMPKGLTSMYMPENQGLSFSNGSYSIEKVVPGFKTIDLGPRNLGKVDCGSEVEFWTKFAWIHAGIRSGAWRIIEGLN